MSQRERQKAASRTAIVAAAAASLRERGDAGTSVQAAMTGAGLTVGAFYAHFSSKSALLREAFEVAMDDGLELARGAAREAAGAEAGDGTGAEALQAVLDRYLSLEHRDSPALGCPLPAVLGESAVGEPSDQTDAWVAGVERMCAVLVEVGGCSRAEALAQIALMVGGQVLARALRALPISEEVLSSGRQVGGRLHAPGADDDRS